MNNHCAVFQKFLSCGLASLSRILIPSLVVFLLALQCWSADEWIEEKSEHFIIQYQESSDDQWADQVLRESEKYYNLIASQIGYSRYQNYWTWDDRVRIIVYRDKDSFVKEAKQPEWSKGGVIQESEFFKARTMITYKQEENFLNGVLPHEIAHLVLKDMIGSDASISVWFEEGVAQLQEGEKKKIADQFMRYHLKENDSIPLLEFFAMEINRETDPQMVSEFYAQSVSIVDFLIKKYGSSNFGELCRNMREGESFERALKKVYRPSIETVDDLEKKWLRYMKN